MALRQRSIEDTSNWCKTRKTSMQIFLERMDCCWQELISDFTLCCPKEERDHPSILVGDFFRIHSMQQWVGYSEPTWRIPGTIP